MLNVFPQLADAEIEYAWGGIIDISMSRAPNFGRLDPNIYYLAGLFRPRHGPDQHRRKDHRGIDRGPGRAIRHLREDCKHLDFPGGTLFRRPTLVLAMTWFRLRDLPALTPIEGLPLEIVVAVTAASA